jgi:hypothetical protein
LAFPTLPPPSPDLAAAMIGIWRLVSREDCDQDGGRNIDPILGADPLGVLSFAPGLFAAQFTKRDRCGATAVSPTAAGANNSAAVGGYDAYFGSYTVDEAAGTITVRLEGALSPSSIGATLTRDIRVDRDQLTIQLATTAADGTPVTRTLQFTRAR